VLVATLVLSACAPMPPPGPAVRRTISGSWGSELVPSATLAYGPLPEHLLDVHPRAEGTEARGTIVFVHGGGFTSGHRGELTDGHHGGILAQTARGFDVVSIGYRLAPDAPFPAARDDVALAVAWVRAAGATHALATERIVVVGHSAGGSLAAMVGTTPGAPTAFGPVPRVDGWVSVAGMSSFENRGLLADFPGRWGLEGDGARRAASPLATLDRTDPPGHLVHGDLDVFVRDAHAGDLWRRGVVTGAVVGYDRVDRGPAACRGHLPMCGADMDAFERFLDGLH
jgi:acetyl esterase/lipase